MRAFTLAAVAALPLLSASPSRAQEPLPPEPPAIEEPGEEERGGDEPDDAAGDPGQRAEETRDAKPAELQRLPLRVTNASGRFVDIDRGRSSGLAVGDRVLFFPLGAPAFEGLVRLVEEDTARVELEQVEAAVEPGLRGEAQVPAARLEALSAARDSNAAEVPEHPPWSRPAEEWDESKPLLAPVESPAPEERPSELHGRAYTLLDFIDDSQGEGRQYTRSLTGLDLAWTNPFGQGGRLIFDGAFSYRDTDTGSGGDTDTILRLERLSYAWGGLRGNPHRVEAGRFLQHEFPELGVLDGVEYTFRAAGGTRFGASLGYLPIYFDRMEASDDLAAAVYFRWVSDPSERLAIGGAYQKTWHEGEADRDLVLGTLDWWIAERTTLRGAAWVDLYGADELVKEEGAELTELHLRLDQRFAQAGVGLFASRTRWPDLRRNELPPVTLPTLADGEVTRAGVDAWLQVSEPLRLGGRADAWEDQVDSGASGELRVGLSNWLYARGVIDLGVFATQGRFSDLVGGRVSASKWLGPHVLRLTYELRDFDQQDFLGEQATLVHHLVRAGLDLAIGRDWDLSLQLDSRFGDEQDALAASIFLQRSF